MTDTDRIVLYMARQLLTGTPLTNEQKATMQQYITTLDIADAHARIEAANDQLRALAIAESVNQLLELPIGKELPKQKQMAEQQLKIETQHLASLMEAEAVSNKPVGNKKGKGAAGKGKGLHTAQPLTTDALIKQHIVWQDTTMPDMANMDAAKQEATIGAYGLVVQQYPQGYLWAAYKNMQPIPGQQSMFMGTMQLAKQGAESFLIQTLVQHFGGQTEPVAQNPPQDPTTPTDKPFVPDVAGWG